MDAGHLEVVVADDHAVVRTGVRALLDPQPDLRVVAEAADAQAAVAAVRRHHPAVVVLDIHMPGQESVDAIPRMLELSPGTRVLVLTMNDDPLLVRRALDAGAAGYVLKEAAPLDLVRAVRAIAAGRRYVHPTLGAELAASDDDPLARLSEREREVLVRVVRGATNKEVAAELCLSVRTVETHRARLQDKLGVSGLLPLVEFARRHRLLDD